MSELPTYEQSVNEKKTNITREASDTTSPHRYSIRDEVSVSRSQHVAVLVSRVLPSIKERAKEGISRSTLILIPSDQAEHCAKGQLVGFPDDDPPVLVQLEGRFDSTQFWAQQEALNLLREQMFDAVCGEVPQRAVEAQRSTPQRPPQLPAKPSFWGRRQSSKTDEAPVEAKPPAKPPVTIDVFLDQVSFRGENEYGLFETVRARGVQVTVNVR